MLNLINMPIRPFVRRMTFAGKALGAAALILTAVACAVDGEEVAEDDGLGDAAEACTMSTEMRDTQSGSVKECSTTRYANMSEAGCAKLAAAPMPAEQQAAGFHRVNACSEAEAIGSCEADLDGYAVATMYFYRADITCEDIEDLCADIDGKASCFQ